MEISHPLADPELCEVLESHAQRGMAHSSTEKHALKEIRETLIYNLTNARTTLGDLSAQLGMSSRSLQRSMLANGMTFRELLDDVRQERAPLLLRNLELSMKEVASRLQFSDISWFLPCFLSLDRLNPYRLQEGTSG